MDTGTCLSVNLRWFSLRLFLYMVQMWRSFSGVLQFLNVFLLSKVAVCTVILSHDAGLLQPVVQVVMWPRRKHPVPCSVQHCWAMVCSWSGDFSAFPAHSGAMGGNCVVNHMHLNVNLSNSEKVNGPWVLEHLNKRTEMLRDLMTQRKTAELIRPRDTNRKKQGWLGEVYQVNSCCVCGMVGGKGSKLSLVINSCTSW